MLFMDILHTHKPQIHILDWMSDWLTDQFKIEEHGIYAISYDIFHVYVCRSVCLCICVIERYCLSEFVMSTRKKKKHFLFFFPFICIFSTIYGSRRSWRWEKKTKEMKNQSSKKMRNFILFIHHISFVVFLVYFCRRYAYSLYTSLAFSF